MGSGYHIGGFKGGQWYNKRLDKIRSQRERCKKGSICMSTFTSPGLTNVGRTYLNCIGGAWQPAQSGQTFPNYNPATGELLGHFPLSGAAEANAAVAAASAAYEKW